jgi:hypothetical protein
MTCFFYLQQFAPNPTNVPNYPLSFLEICSVNESHTKKI